MKLGNWLCVALLFVCFAQGTRGYWTLIGGFDEGRGASQSNMVAFGKWSKPPAIQLVFTTFDMDDSHWLFNELTNIWETAHVPMVTWEPWFWTQETPSDIEIKIARGDYNQYLDMWIGKMRHWLAGPDTKLNTGDDRRAFLRFAHEFNGNWYPWSAKKGESTPQDFVKMWRYVWTKFRKAGIGKEHLVFVWAAICYDLGDFTLEQYWPGEKYVDWVGVNGLNWGNSERWFQWYSPDILFRDILPRLKAVSNYRKPIGITEVGTVSIGKGVAGKLAWLGQLFKLIDQHKIRMVNYFNMDKVEGPPNTNGKKDWAIFGGRAGDQTFVYRGQKYRAYSKWKQEVSKSRYVASDVTRTKLIDDIYFWGTGACQLKSDCLSGYNCRGGVCREGTANTPAKGLSARVVFSDRVMGKIIKWGSQGYRAKINQPHDRALEGSLDIQYWSKGWGGVGVIWNATNVRGYKALRFWAQSTGDVKIEIQDRRLKKASFYIGKTAPGQWKLVTIAFTSFMGKVDLSALISPFLATMLHPGYFAIDHILLLR